LWPAVASLARRSRFELAAEGLSVAVFDAQHPGREASWASAGMISPAPESSEMASLLPIGMASVHLYPEFIQRVEELSDRTVGYRKDGALDLLLNGTGRQRSTKFWHCTMGRACARKY